MDAFIQVLGVLLAGITTILGVLALVSYIGILGVGLYIVVAGVFFAWWEGR
jgi:hypothetical protein